MPICHMFLFINDLSRQLSAFPSLRLFLRFVSLSTHAAGCNFAQIFLQSQRQGIGVKELARIRCRQDVHVPEENPATHGYHVYTYGNVALKYTLSDLPVFGLNAFTFKYLYLFFMVTLSLL